MFNALLGFAGLAQVLVLPLFSAATSFEAPFYGQGCTAIAVGKDATEGSVMVSHGNDCPTCDFRVAYVPHADHAEGTHAPVWIDFDDYPRFVVADSIDADASFSTAKIYESSHLEPGYEITTQRPPMGYIPQVPHTYAYVDGAYGIMNEHGLSIGESTCDARLGQRGIPIEFGGNALFGIAQLSRFALQRCKTARCAVQLMGDLAVEHGYYGANRPEWAEGKMKTKLVGEAEGGEALTIGDKKEAWVFNICPDDTGTSAVWVAQRVPDDEVTAVTNTFTIGEIDLSDPDYFMASENVFDVAAREGLWDKDGKVPFDFAQIFRSTDGHSLPSSPERKGIMLRDRRRWVIFHTVAPSVVLDPYKQHAWDDSDKYLPFSVKPDHKLTERDVFRIHRDIYQDTPFDITKKAVGGPFGDPYRGIIPQESPFNDSEEWNGSFERTVAQLWTSYTTITQSRDWLPDHIGSRVWFGPHSAVTSAFTPVYPGAAKLSGRFPKAIESGSLLKFNEDSYWWWVTLVANYAGRFYSVSIDMVQDAQASLEESLLDMTKKAEDIALAQSKEDAFATLEKMQKEVSEFSLAQWRAFFFQMVTNFHDGMFFEAGEEGSAMVSSKAAYPSWWLKLLGPKDAGLSQYASPDGGYQVESNDTDTDKKEKDEGLGVKGVLLIATLSALVGLGFGYWEAGRHNKAGYQTIPQ